MFGVGGQELVIIGLLLLIVFGPARIGQMAREVGRFAYGARSSLEEVKAELADVAHPVEHPNRRADGDAEEQGVDREPEEDRTDAGVR